jgi:hypothetical protein
MEKTATLGMFAKNLGSNIAQGVGVGIATGAAAGVGLAAHKVYEALTKGRDFRAMMQNPFNQDLKELHDSNPANFNAAFTGLRQANPEMSGNPMIAGTYMRRMMTFSPDAAGGYLLEARGHRSEDLSPLRDAFQRGAVQGVQTSFQERLRDQGELEREGRRPALERRVMEATDPLRRKLEEHKQDYAAGLQELARPNQLANQKELERFKAENQQRVKEEARPKEMEWLKGLHRAGLKG